MADHIPEGYGFVAGRSGEKARELLALVDASDIEGIDRKVAVRTTQGGYFVDARLLDDSDDEGGTVHDAAGTVESSTGDGAEDQSSGSDDEKPPAPAKNASAEAWAIWATKVHGYDPAEELGRNELIERYGA